MDMNREAGRKQKRAEARLSPAQAARSLRNWRPRRAVAILAAVLLSSVAAWSVWQRGGFWADPDNRGKASGDLVCDDWFASFVNGAKIGHAHRTVRKFFENGQEFLELNELHQLSAAKGSDRVESSIKISQIATPQGGLVRFKHELLQSQQPIVTIGKVNGQFLDCETTTAGGAKAFSLPWTADIEGFDGLERILRGPPIRPGQTRRFKSIAVEHAGLSEHELIAANYEEVSLREARRKLLRVQWIVRFPRGMTVSSTLWVDNDGQWHKQSNEDFGLEIYRVSKEQALAADKSGSINLLLDMLIKTARPIANPGAARSIRFRVRLAEQNPAELFATGASQKVESRDGLTADITVRSARWFGSGFPTDAGDPPVDDDRNPGVMIQSQHPLVGALANEVQSGATDPARLAVALERHVHARMKRVDFTQAFATAGEVARYLKGDCSEHTVLLAALLRARGIPARVAMGLVYVEPAQAFGYHMWTEAWVGGRWLPLDGTLGQGGAGATHIKVAATSLAAGLGDASFLRIARLLRGKPTIEVLGVE
jgi:hypothetical protein